MSSSRVATQHAAELEEVWVAQALRRDTELNEKPELARTNDDVFRDARARIR